MKVSVIVPNYNHAKYLEERIESILNQSYRDFELIILDDKSTDNSIDIIEKYRGCEKVSCVVVNEDNTGNTFKQWYLGISLAKGEYIWVAESDDYADPNFLEYCVAALDKYPSASFSFADSNFVDKDGKPHNSSSHLERLVMPVNNVQSGVIVYDGYILLRDRLLYSNYIYNASMVLFRKSLVSSVYSEYINCRAMGDLIFWASLASQHDVVRVPLRLNNFRQHENKVSSRNLKNKFRGLEDAKVSYYLLDIFMQEAKNRGDSSSFIRKIRNRFIRVIFKRIARAKVTPEMHKLSVELKKMIISKYNIPKYYCIYLNLWAFIKSKL